MKIKHKTQISLEEMSKEQELLQTKLEGYKAGTYFRNGELILMAHPGSCKCDWCGRSYYNPNVLGTYNRGGGASLDEEDLCTVCISKMIQQHNRYEKKEITGDEYRTILKNYRSEVRSNFNGI